jgi:hypothetical protein
MKRISIAAIAALMITAPAMADDKFFTVRKLRDECAA